MAGHWYCAFAVNDCSFMIVIRQNDQLKSLRQILLGHFIVNFGLLNIIMSSGFAPALVISSQHGI